MIPVFPIYKMTNRTDDASAVQLFADLQRLAMLMRIPEKPRSRAIVLANGSDVFFGRRHL